MMKNARVKNLLRNIFLFGVPVGLWLSSFYTLVVPKIKLSADAQCYYYFTNYYLNHIARGVYPLWSPFTSWGRPEGMIIRSIGEYNPFLYLVFLFRAAGMSFATSYLSYLLIYLLLGFAGFYLLARRLFHHKAVAYLMFNMILFSSMVKNVFSDTVVVLMFVCSVWFFYFLTAFTQERTKFHFLGLAFSSMIIAITYLPFYFMTTFLIFMIGFIALYFQEIPRICADYFKFFRQNKIFTTFCLAAICLSLLPGLLWFAESSPPTEYTADWRSGGGSHLMQLLSYTTLNLGNGMIGPYDPTYFFANQDVESGLFHAPMFALVVLLMGMIVVVNRRMLLLFGVSLFLFLISLGDVTPVHKFFYDRIFYFQLFRNLHFLLYLYTPIAMLFIGAQMDHVLNMPVRTSRKKALMITWTVVVHMGFLIFLLRLDNVFVSSFIVVILSMVFFIFYFLGRISPRGGMILAALFVLTALHPQEIMFHYRKTLSLDAVEVPSRAQTAPKFYFVRPLQSEYRLHEATVGYGEVADAPGFEYGRYLRTKWSVFFKNKFDSDAIEDYVRYKFWIYDTIEFIPEDGPLNINRIQAFFRDRKNLAFVASQRQTGNTQNTKGAASPKAVPVTQNTDTFSVIRFDINFIKFRTNFPKEKFLVYNDSYQSDWHAFVNGQPVKLLRANVAFKGLWLPAGENIVLLRFHSPARMFLHLFLIVFFMGVLLCLLGLAFRQQRIGQTTQT